MPSASAATARPLYALHLTSVPAGRCFAQGSAIGASLLNVFNGFGTQCIGKDAELVQSPSTADGVGSTHAALSITRPVFRGSYRITAGFVTLRQLRSPPNAWEVGWVLWDYLDVNHFYGLIVKPSGWEIEKEWCNPQMKPCQAEQFLSVGSLPAVEPGTPLRVEITQLSSRTGLTFSVRLAIADQPFSPLGSATDVGAASSPYRYGHVGLYDEESVVAWRSLVVRG